MMDGWMDMDGLIAGWMNRWMDKQMDGWINEMDGWMDEQMDGSMNC